MDACADLNATVTRMEESDGGIPRAALKNIDVSDRHDVFSTAQPMLVFMDCDVSCTWK